MEHILCSCSNCNASLFPPEGGNGVCRAHPPTACVVVLPQGQLQVRLQPVPVSALPNITPDGWCREWQRKGFEISLKEH